MRMARLIGPELESLLRENPAEIRELLDEIHPEDIADVVEELDIDRAAELLSELPTEYAAQVFERLEDDQQAALTPLIGLEEVTEIAVEMDADERADFVGHLPEHLSKPLLRSLERADPEVAEDVEELTRWPETSAGGLMTTDFVSIDPDLRVGDATEVIRKLAEDAETVDTLFVITKEEHLAGVLSLRDMLLAKSDDVVHEVMTRNIISVPPEMDQEDVARKLAKYDLNTMPVVDADGELLGVITADDILDVLTEEQSEDVHKMGAVEPLREGYFDTSVFTFIRKRAPWLLILFLGGFLTTWAMERFDDVLVTLAQLTLFLPLLIAAGGNSGSQSSTLVIRGLAVGDIRTGDWWRVLVRELILGISLGALLAVSGLLRVILGGGDLPMALLIAGALVAIVVMGCVVGGMMPILLHRLGLDPATSSTPFIATLVDVLGIVIYLGLARWLLMGALGTAAAG